jgi:hypothetical protein
MFQKVKNIKESCTLVSIQMLFKSASQQTYYIAYKLTDQKNNFAVILHLKL